MGDSGEEEAPLLPGPKDGGPAASEALDGFGGKSIGFLASMCLLCNNMCSSGMVQIPATFQGAGWLFPTTIFLVMTALSCLAALYLCKAVSWVQGNREFTKRVEFSGFARAVFPRWLYLLTVAVLIFSFTANNISAIVVSAQVMDSTIVAVTRHTCALVIYDRDSHTSHYNNATNTTITTGSDAVFRCIDNVPPGSDSPFGRAYVISIGFLVVMAAVVPLGYLNLDDNMWVQVGGIFLLVSCVMVWSAQFIDLGLHASRIPAVATGGYDGVISNIVFNYGYVATVPSWLNEKGPGVSIVTANLTAVVLATTLYLVLGVFGAMALDGSSVQDVLSAIDSDSRFWTVSQVGTYVFPIASLLSSIPVFAILIRYNLLNTGICSKRTANIVAVLLPWLLALFFYTGNQLNMLIDWSSAAFFVFLNLTIPLYMYIRQYMLKGFHHDGSAWDDSAYRHSQSLSPIASTSSLLQPVNDDIIDAGDHAPSLEAAYRVAHDHDDLPLPDALYVLPRWMRMRVVSEITLAYFLFIFTILLAFASMAEQIQTVW
eukprot:m.142786 g.142786  ORF g.142786 m.142786 type:complete len:543 (-) comp9654_c0_seq5:255-1883(-)